MPTPYNYQNLAQIAHKNLARFGRKPNRTHLRRVVNDVNVDRVVTAIEADFAPREVDGQVVRRNDLRFLISVIGLTLDPDQVEDLLVLTDDLGNETAYVIASEPKRTAPGGVNVFWQLHVRSK